MISPLEHRGVSDKEATGWAAMLRGALARRTRLLEEPPGPGWATRLLELELDIVGLAAALGQRPSLAQGVSSASTWGAAVALSQWFREGHIVIDLGDQKPHWLPAGSDRLTPPQWRRILACACLARNHEAMAILARPGMVDRIVRDAVSDDVTVGAEPFWSPACQLFAAVSRGEPAAPELVKKSRTALRTGDSGVIDPPSLEALELPMVDLLKALQAADAATWKALVNQALDRFERYYTQPDWANLTSGMFPLAIAALCALAHDRHANGDEFIPESPYLPSWLIRGDIPRDSTTILYRFPRRAARDSREIHWWLDLEGIPRSGREAHLVEEEGVLIARYRLSGWDVLPHAEAEFTLEDNAPGPILLDAGELLLVSDWHAKKVSGHPEGSIEHLRAQRSHLREAIAALETLIALIPPASDRIPSNAISSERGLEVYRAEPGRVERERLQAVRRVYADILEQIDRKLRQTPNTGSASP